MEYATPLLFILTICLVFVLGIILGRLTMIWTMREYADITNVPTDISDAMRVKTIGEGLVVMHAHSFGSAAQSFSRARQEMFEYRAESDRNRENFAEMTMQRDECLETIARLKAQLDKKQKGGGKKE